MMIRAILFDVYGTLLRVGPPPADADARWAELFRDLLQRPPRLGRVEFSVACSRGIAQRHQAARARGIPHPEIHWPAIVAEVLPECAQLPAEKAAEFVFRQMQIGRTIRLHDGAVTTLAALHREGRLLGIASNSQAYTLRELQTALSSGGLALEIFDRDLRFWSFEHGFSKPDPHVFQMLTARLEARGIAPGETLMVGDRFDNDIQPARAFGWQTWLLTSSPGSGEPGQGTFAQMLAWLK